MRKREVFSFAGSDTYTNAYDRSKADRPWALVKKLMLDIDPSPTGKV